MHNSIFARRYCGIEPRHFPLFQNYCVSSSCFCAKINFSRSIPINFIPCENDTILQKLLSAVYTCSRIKCFLHSMSFKDDSFLYNNSITLKIHRNLTIVSFVNNIVNLYYWYKFPKNWPQIIKKLICHL